MPSVVNARPSSTTTRTKSATSGRGDVGRAGPAAAQLGRAAVLGDPAHSFEPRGALAGSSRERAARLHDGRRRRRARTRDPVQPDASTSGGAAVSTVRGREQARPGQHGGQRLRHGAEPGVDHQREVDRAGWGRARQLRHQRRQPRHRAGEVPDQAAVAAVAGGEVAGDDGVHGRGGRLRAQQAGVVHEAREQGWDGPGVRSGRRRHGEDGNAVAPGAPAGPPRPADPYSLGSPDLEVTRGRTRSDGHPPRPTPSGPAAPPPAAATAALVGTGAAPATPLVHHVRADGSARAAARRRRARSWRVRRPRAEGWPGDAGAHRPAPVDLREPVRGLLWLTGRLTAARPGAARRSAAAGGGGAARDPACCASATAPRSCGSTRARPCSPTPRAPPRWRRWSWPRPGPTRSAGRDGRGSRTWRSRTPRVRRAAPAPARRAAGRPEARVRPLGVDRCGLRLRVETPGATTTCGWPGPGDDHPRRAGVASPAAAPGGVPGPARLTGVRPARTRAVTRRSATKLATGTVPATRIDQRVERLPPGPLGQQERADDVGHVEEAVRDADHGHQLRLAEEVLQRHRHEHQDQQADAGDPRGDPVAAQQGADRQRVVLLVLAGRAASSASMRLYAARPEPSSTGARAGGGGPGTERGRPGVPGTRWRRDTRGPGRPGSTRSAAGSPSAFPLGGGPPPCAASATTSRRRTRRTPATAARSRR